MRSSNISAGSTASNQLRPIREVRIGGRRDGKRLTPGLLVSAPNDSDRPIVAGASRVGNQG
jgi:hypothetical protein